MEIISNEEKNAQFADNIVMRTYEVYAYESNIENYKEMLMTLSNEWPERLLPLKGVDPHIAANECALEDVDLLSDLQQHDRISYLLRTEMLERNKSKKILEMMELRLPLDIKDAEIAKAIARRNIALQG